MEGLLLFRQPFSFFYGIQKQGNLIHIQADDLFFVKLRELYEGSWIYGDLFCSKKVIIKALQGRELTHDPALLIDHLLVVIIKAVFQIFHIFFQITQRDLF